MTGNIITPTATVRAMVRQREILASTGVGPVDAAVNAVQGILESEHPSTSATSGSKP